MSTLQHFGNIGKTIAVTTTHQLFSGTRNLTPAEKAEVAGTAVASVALSILMAWYYLKKKKAKQAAVPMNRVSAYSLAALVSAIVSILTYFVVEGFNTGQHNLARGALIGASVCASLSIVSFIISSVYPRK